MTRKEVSSREVLTSYDKAKVHALNYLRRSQFPSHPSIHQAICYWAAGLLSEKAHFKDEKIQESTLLIEEARRLLKPYVRKGEDFFTVSGDEWYWEEYMKSESVPRPRRNRVPPPPPPSKDDPWGGEEKERLIHGHYHENPHYKPYKPHHHKKPFHKQLSSHKPHDPCKPEYTEPLWIKRRYENKYKLTIEPVITETGGTVHLRARVYEGSKPCDKGKVTFYIYEE